MKKNFYPFALVAFIVIVFTSCQKESADKLTTHSLKVKTYTEDVTSSYWGNSVTTYNLSYDSGDRLVNLADAANPGNKFVFAYPSSSKYSMDIFNNNVKDLHVDYLLNSQSLIDSSFQYNNTGDTLTEKYIYNAARQLTTLHQYDYSVITGANLWKTTSYTYDGGGNMIKSEDSDQTSTYEYYTDKVYLMPQLMPMLAASQKASLLKKVTLSVNGNVLGSTSNTYTFDSKDRISTIRYDYSDGTMATRTFTYFD